MIKYSDYLLENIHLLYILFVNKQLLPSILTMDFFDWICLVSPWTAPCICLPSECLELCLIWSPILTYSIIIITIGTRKNKSELNSYMGTPVGTFLSNIAQNALSYAGCPDPSIQNNDINQLSFDNY